MAVASTSSLVPDTIHNDDDEFLDTVEGEIAFFRSLMRARPVGAHRHFRIMAMRNAILSDTGKRISIEAMWQKLRGYYNLDALEAADSEHENLYTPHKNSPPIPIPSPKPDEELGNHPYFRAEFQLPYDSDILAMLNEKRMRSSDSAPSTPSEASPTYTPPTTRRQKVSKKRGKSQSKLAGLVGGDSDSSALTQESGDEVQAETPRESVVTGTDGGTEDGEEEDVEMQEAAASSSRRSASPKPTRGRTKGARGKKGARGGASTRAAAKKRKR
ncbi:hypothetical protein BKA70DRAFT_1372076 [Coprinopsis sp. MPI-PUGE-AT-0042]|nr:hypothetical protein BKA70DRAFT_1372076 [Coprinopsis sp. MPI-PUGE-AT-0042]